MNKFMIPPAFAFFCAALFSRTYEMTAGEPPIVFFGGDGSFLLAITSALLTMGFIAIKEAPLQPLQPQQQEEENDGNESKEDSLVMIPVIHHADIPQADISQVDSAASVASKDEGEIIDAEYYCYSDDECPPPSEQDWADFQRSQATSA